MLPPGKGSLPNWEKLSNFPQLTVEINFEYDSVTVVPESCRALGLIADALHHPLLLQVPDRGPHRFGR
jgi:hypothetical protein